MGWHSINFRGDDRAVGKTGQPALLLWRIEMRCIKTGADVRIGNLTFHGDLFAESGRFELRGMPSGCHAGIEGLTRFDCSADHGVVEPTSRHGYRTIQLGGAIIATQEFFAFLEKWEGAQVTDWIQQEKIND